MRPSRPFVLRAALLAMGLGSAACGALLGLHSDDDLGFEAAEASASDVATTPHEAAADASDEATLTDTRVPDGPPSEGPSSDGPSSDGLAVPETSSGSDAKGSADSTVIEDAASPDAPPPNAGDSATRLAIASTPWTQITSVSPRVTLTTVQGGLVVAAVAVEFPTTTIGNPTVSVSGSWTQEVSIAYARSASLIVGFWIATAEGGPIDFTLSSSSSDFTTALVQLVEYPAAGNPQGWSLDAASYMTSGTSGSGTAESTVDFSKPISFLVGQILVSVFAANAGFNQPTGTWTDYDISGSAAFGALFMDTSTSPASLSAPLDSPADTWAGATLLLP